MSIDLSLYPDGTTLDASGRLLIGGCPVAELAERFGTPAMLLDAGALRRRAREYQEAFTSRHARSRVLFAAKSFPSASVIRLLVEAGCGVDTAAWGELRMAIAAGADPHSIVLHGNAKTDADIRAAIEAGVGHVVIDNLDDLERIARLATNVVPVLLRVSPSVTAATHEAMQTGHEDSKFGVPPDRVDEVVAALNAEPRVSLRGLHAHIGSQVADLDQFRQEVAALAEFGRFGVYDLGGGLGVRYVSSDAVPTVDEYAEAVVSQVHSLLGTEVELLVEPGRSMIARSVVTAYRTVTVKRGRVTHLAVDGGMGDNLEVSLYGQPFAPSVIDRDGDPEVVDVVGRHCESGDRLAQAVEVVSPRVGDLVVVPVTGAYCFTMANNYNTALKPPVVFCEDGVATLAVRRQDFSELLDREMLLP
jgi:diaminopimelate decarboxylase